MNDKTIVFNTGRQYSIKGQRIAATLLDDGRVMFADIDRGIDGITKEKYAHERLMPSILQNFVMREYDHGKITYGYYEFSEDYKIRESEGFNLMQGLIAYAKTI